MMVVPEATMMNDDDQLFLISSDLSTIVERVCDSLSPSPRKSIRAGLLPDPQNRFRKHRNWPSAFLTFERFCNKS